MKISFINIVFLLCCNTIFTMDDLLEDQDWQTFFDNALQTRQSKHNNNASGATDNDCGLPGNMIENLLDTDALNQYPLVAATTSDQSAIYTCLDNNGDTDALNQYPLVAATTSDQSDIRTYFNSQPLPPTDNPAPNQNLIFVMVAPPPARPSQPSMLQNMVTPPPAKVSRSSALANPAPIERRIRKPNLQDRRQFSCSGCKKKFTSIYHCRDHERKCPLVPWNFNNNNNNQHTQVAKQISSHSLIDTIPGHSVQENPDFKDAANRQKTYLQYLKLSFKKEDDNRLYCMYPQCKQSYLYQSEKLLESHRLTHNPIESERLIIPCTVIGCLRRFAKDWHLEKHLSMFHHHAQTQPTTCVNDDNDDDN